MHQPLPVVSEDDICSSQQWLGLRTAAVNRKAQALDQLFMLAMVHLNLNPNLYLNLYLNCVSVGRHVNRKALASGPASRRSACTCASARRSP